MRWRASPAADLLDTTLPGDIQRLLDHWGIDASLLVLEITERIIAVDPSRHAEVLERLCALGVRLSLDDFGTGSSALSYLRALPVQELKIDRSLIASLANGDPRDLAVVRTIIRLAHDLGLRAVAEGIETKNDCERLREWDCDEGQCFYLARPMPPEGVTELLRADAGAEFSDDRRRVAHSV